MKRRDMVELRFRLPAEGWTELAALLRALLGSQGNTAGEQTARSGGENAAFDEAVFRRLSEMGGEEAGPARFPGEQDENRRYRAEAYAAEPLTAPVPAGAISPAEGEAPEREGREEDWERRLERDCRRYDSGFPLR